MSEHTEHLTVAQVAARAGITESTWRSYVARGQAPAPDDRVGATPLWDAVDVDAWIAHRPGQGARTDRDRFIDESGRVRWFESTGIVDDDLAALGLPDATATHQREHPTGRAWSVWAGPGPEAERLGTIHYARS